MFCTNLRKRPDLSSILPLLTSSTNPPLRGKSAFHILPLLLSNPTPPENTLQTHDLALPALHSPNHNQHLFLFLLLSPSSLQTPQQSQLLERLARFSSLTSSPTPVIALLLNTGTDDAQPNPTPTENGMHAYMTLQSLYVPYQTRPQCHPSPTY